MPTADFDSIPRLRWSDADHRFHFNMPFAAEPGADGFVLLQQIDGSDSLNAMSLPPSERQHIKEMERFNAIIKEVENSAHLRDTVKFLERQRAHSDEFHERVVTEDDLKPRVVKKKSFRDRPSAKHASNQPRQKPTRMGRVQQPK
jgi:hypothetical protein